MNRLMLFFVLVTLGVFLVPIKCLAQQNESEVIELGEIVVSATRMEMPVFDAPQNVSVLTSEDIMTSPFERVEDIVRSVPGMYNFRHYALQTNGIVNPLKMRGVGKNRVLILVDGVPQNDNFNNSIAWVAWGHIPKEAIERIEIVRGPASALYGSEGLGGVIHIITKKPKDERKTSIRGEAGTADTYAGYGFHTQKIKDFGFMVAGGYEESDGFYMVEHPQSYEIKRYRDVGKVFGKATYNLTPAADISLAALYYDHETGKGRKFFYDDLTLDQYWMKYNHNGESFDLKGLVYLNRADKTAFQDTAKDNYSSLFRKEEVPSTTWGADFQGTIPFGSGKKFTLGTAYKEVSWDYDDKYIAMTRREGAEGKQRFVSPFANVDFRFLDDNLIVNLGARFDWIETFHGANWDTAASAGKPPYHNKYSRNTEESFCPKFSIAWHPDDKTTLRASGGKGFRMPSLFELYKVHVRGGGTYYREANPDLEPERIWSYDVGAERFLPKNLWGRLTFYQSFAKDYIGERLIGKGTFAGGKKTRDEYKLDNITEVDIYGIETELQWYPMNDLTLFANYTFNISKIKKDENDPDLEGKYLPNDPRHNFHFGFRYQNAKIGNVSVTTNYYGKIYYNDKNTMKKDGYWTVDIAVSRRFFNRFTVYVNAENIFDEKYPIFRSPSVGDTIAPGAIFTCGLKYEF